MAAPDMEKALRLAPCSCTAAAQVKVKLPPFGLSHASWGLVGDYMIELLDELGYVGSVNQVDTDHLYSPKLEFDMAVNAFIMDYPATSNFIKGWFTCDAPLTPLSGFCDPQIDAMIERATQMQIDDPVAAGHLWAEIDRKIVDQAPYVWLVNPIAVQFVSERVGNYQYSQQWGVLLDQMWVR